MRKFQRLYRPILITLLMAAVLGLANPFQAYGQMTIPTRTPAPPDNPDPPPTDDNGGGGGGGGDNGGNNPVPTSTPVPQDTPVPPAISIPPTNTATPLPLVSPTPLAGETIEVPDVVLTAEAEPSATIDFADRIDQIAPGSTPVDFPIVATAFPTAEPCGEPPTLTTLTIANVYEGPGSDYDVRDTLAADEVRPIVGRAAFATWWLIQLDDQYQQGWISDKAGVVQGFTGNVPIIEPPLINGVLPTPGAAWDPTPAPACTPTPTPTTDGNVVSGSIIDYSDSSPSTVRNNTDVELAVDQRSQMAEAAAPLDLEVPATTPTPNLLPIAGLVLVIAAIFVALFLRRSPGGSDTSS